MEMSLGTTWSPPERLQPRDRYVVEVEPVRHGRGWDYALIRVLRHEVLSGVAADLALEPVQVAEFIRNYPTELNRHGTIGIFESFRQGGHDYALISRDHTRTAVLDLETGK